MERDCLDRIALLLSEKRISIRKLSMLTGIAPTTIHDIVNGKYKSVSAENLYKIAEALGTTVEFLRFGHDITSVYKHSDEVNNIAANLERLNDDGLHKVEDYVDDLLENNKYLK